MMNDELFYHLAAGFTRLQERGTELEVDNGCYTIRSIVVERFVGAYDSTLSDFIADTLHSTCTQITIAIRYYTRLDGVSLLISGKNPDLEPLFLVKFEFKTIDQHIFIGAPTVITHLAIAEDITI